VNGRVIGLDVGTSSLKGVLVDVSSGAVVRVAERSYPLSTPRPGWAEQDPEDWWRAAVGVLGELGDADGIGLTGQMHGLVALDEADRPVRPAILWNDGRSQPQCDLLIEELGLSRLVSLSGNRPLAGFTAPKLLWMREHEPELFARIRRVMLPKDYVRFRLTGEFATDVSDASGTLLLDVGARTWSPELCSALGIDPEWLPPVLESAEVSGTTRPGLTTTDNAAVGNTGNEDPAPGGTHAAGTARGDTRVLLPGPDGPAAGDTRLLVRGGAGARPAPHSGGAGIRPGIPVAAGAGDQAAGALGVGVLREGEAASVVLGTSGVVFAARSAFAPDAEGRLHAFCHAAPQTWHVMGVMLSAAGSLRWLRDATDPSLPFDTLVDEAAKWAPGVEGLAFAPYLAGERTPHPDADARGAFVGLSLRHDRGALARAVLEGVSFGLRDSLDLITQTGARPTTGRLSGGGSRSALWRQILAATLDLPLERTAVSEGAAYGAALLGAIAAGHFPDAATAIATCVHVTDRTDPDPSLTETYTALHQRHRQLYPTLRPLSD
jgi:xylulokinase